MYLCKYMFMISYMQNIEYTASMLKELSALKISYNEVKLDMTLKFQCKFKFMEIEVPILLKVQDNKE